MTVIIVRNQQTKDAALGIVQRADIEKPWRFEFIPWKKKRSDLQNRLYWVWTDQIRLHVLDCMGIIATRYDVHHDLGPKFLPTCASTNLAGETVERTMSTTELSVSEFTEYLNLVEMHCAADLGLMLTHPEDLYYASMGHGK